MLASVHNFFKRFQRIVPTLIICSGIVLLLISGIHSSWKDRSLRLREEQTPISEYSSDNHRISLYKISIPWRVDVAINSGELIDGKWSIDKNTATHLTQSAYPGQDGNIIVYGHNTREILGNIRVLIPGEKISLFTSDGVEHVYEVEWTQEVSPDDISAIQQTNSEVLTLFTCSGFLDSKRFVVRAKKVSSELTATP